MIIAAAIDFSETSNAISRMPPAIPNTPDSMLVSTTAATMTISISMARQCCRPRSMKKANARNMMLTQVE